MMASYCQSKTPISLTSAILDSINPIPFWPQLYHFPSIIRIFFYFYFFIRSPNHFLRAISARNYTVLMDNQTTLSIISLKNFIFLKFLSQFKIKNNFTKNEFIFKLT